MRARHAVAGLATIVTAVVGLGLATAGSASAVETGSWSPFGNTNPITSSSSRWACGDTTPVATSVIAQVCAIRSSDQVDVQAAVIVRNNRSTQFVAPETSMNLEILGTPFNSWACPSSGLAANSWSVCFGTTQHVDGPEVQSAGHVGTTDLGTSRLV